MFKGEQEYSFDDFLETTIAAGKDITSTGDIDVYLGTLPDDDKGMLVLDSANESKKEIVYFHAKGASYVSVLAINRGLGGTTATTHTAGVAVQCNVVGAMFDGVYDIVKRATGGYVSKLESTGLNVYISPWYGYIDGTYVSYAGTGITGLAMTDEATNYIYVTTSGLTVSTTSFPTTGLYVMLATVTATGGNIGTPDNLAGKKLVWHNSIDVGKITGEVSGTDYTKSKIVAGDYVTLSTNGDTIVITAAPGTGSPNNWTNVNANLLPDSNNARDIGSSSLKFKDFYLAGDADIAGDLTVAGTITGVVNTFNTKAGAIVLAAGSGISITESPSNTFTVASNVDANLIYKIQYFN